MRRTSKRHTDAAARTVSEAPNVLFPPSICEILDTNFRWENQPNLQSRRDRRSVSNSGCSSGVEPICAKAKGFEHFALLGIVNEPQLRF